jgi:hypothetical protein
MGHWKNTLPQAFSYAPRCVPIILYTASGIGRGSGCSCSKRASMYASNEMDGMMHEQSRQVSIRSYMRKSTSCCYLLLVLNYPQQYSGIRDAYTLLYKALRNWQGC